MSPQPIFPNILSSPLAISFSNSISIQRLNKLAVSLKRWPIELKKKKKKSVILKVDSIYMNSGPKKQKHKFQKQLYYSLLWKQLGKNAQ